MINFDDLGGTVTDGLKYVYLVPRAGESDGDYIKRVGIKTAQKHLSPMAINAASNSLGKATNSVWGANVGGSLASGGIAGLTTALYGGDFEDIAISTGKQAGKSFLTNAAGKYAPLASVGLSLVDSFSGDGELQDTMMAASNAGVTSAVAGTAASGYAAVPGIALAVGQTVAQNSKEGQVGMSYDPATDKISLHDNQGNGNYKTSWGNMSNSSKSKVANSLREEYKSKVDLANKYTEGMNSADKESFMDSLGSDFFDTRVFMNEDDMMSFQQPEWDGSLKKVQNGYAGYMSDDYETQLALNREVMDRGGTLDDYVTDFTLSQGDGFGEDMGQGDGYKSKYEDLRQGHGEAPTRSVDTGIDSTALTGPEEEVKEDEYTTSVPRSDGYDEYDGYDGDMG